MRRVLGENFFLLILILCISTICKPCAISACASDNSKVIRIGYYENEVFEEGASDGSVKNGYAYEYYRKLSEYTGWSYEYVYGDFVDVYNMLLKGEVDLVAGLAYKEDRQDKILYPDKPMGSETYSIVKHEDDSSISTLLPSLNGKKIGVLDSAIKDVLDEFLEDKNIRANIVTFTDYETLFKAFDRKDIDLMATETDGTNDRNHAEVLVSFGSSDYYICVNREKGWLLKELNDAQNQLLSEEPDYINLLRNKYYASSLSSRAFTISEKDWISNHTEIKIGYFNNYMPYCDTDKDGNVIGLVKDIVPEIFKNLGINKFDYSYVAFDSYDDMTAALSNSEIDVAFPVGGGLFYSEEDGLYCSKAVTSSTVNLIYSDSYISASSADFAINSNNKMQYYFVKAHYPDSSITFYDSTRECLDAVLDGKVKCTTLNGLRTNSMLKNRAYRKLSFRQLPYNDDRCFGVRIGNEGLLKLLNRGVSVVGQEYSLNLSYQYSDQLNTSSLLDMLLDNIWVIFVAALLVLAVILFFLLRDRNKAKQAMIAKEAEKAEIEKSNKSKTLFLNRLSEDMHNSVDSIIDYANIAGKDIGDRTSEYLGKIKDMSNHLLWLVDDVHDFSSVESGQFNTQDQNYKYKHFITEMKESTPENIKEILEKYDFAGTRLLMVDSIVDIRNQGAAILKKVGFEVHVANNGTEAVDKIVAAPAGYFDVVLMNIQPPNNDGYEASRQIRNLGNSEKARIPIVAVSEAEIEHLKEVME